jgi:hypothetical protein
VTNGSISPSPASGSAGTAIALAVTPNIGYRLKPGSLKYTGPAGDTAVDEATRSFLLPAADVTVSAEFEALTSYRVTFAGMVNGSVTAVPLNAYEGTEITLTVNPKANYRLKSGSLKYTAASVNTAIDETTLKFLLPAANVRVSAEFEPDIYTVSIGSLSHGAISAIPEKGPPGTEIALTVTPGGDYRLKRGSLKYTGAAGDTPIDEATLKFSLPGANVTVTAEFETIPHTEIGSAADLAKIGADSAYPSNGYYILTNDLTLSNWTPLCADAGRAFAGVFNGNGKTITLQSFSGAALSSSSTNKYLGIFGYVKGAGAEKKARITNLAIRSAMDQHSTKTGGQAIGLVAGYIENTELSVIVLSGSFAFETEKDVFAGGIAGWAETGTTITDCTSSTNIEINYGFATYGESDLIATTSYSFVGGFAGLFDHGVEIENCHNTGDTKALGKDTSNASGSNASVVCGGIANGYMAYGNSNYQGEIRNCSNTGAVHAKGGGLWAVPGGIAGAILGDGAAEGRRSKILRSWASGTVSAEGAGYMFAGGISGYPVAGALIADCYFTGSINVLQAANTTTGTIVGQGVNTNGVHNVIPPERCLSNGTITVAGVNLGNGIGINAPQSNTNVALAAGDTRPHSYYAGLGWDFVNTWKMGGDGHPHL